MTSDARRHSREPTIIMSSNQIAEKHYVYIVHGIRTFAEWSDVLSFELQTIPGLEPRNTYHGRVSTFDFLFSGHRRDKSIQAITDELKRLSCQEGVYPKPKLSVVAHSFGAYATLMALQSETKITLHHLILCGAVTPEPYNWSALRTRVDGEFINDCGTKDPWPVVAAIVRGLYFACGSRGIPNALPGEINNRFFSLGHSGFLQKSFFRRWWLPIFGGATDCRDCSDAIEPHTPKKYPWWMRKLLVAQDKKKMIFGVALPAALASAIYLTYSNTCFLNVDCDANTSVIVERTADYSLSRCADVAGVPARIYQVFYRDSYSLSKYRSEFKAQFRPSATAPEPQIFNALDVASAVKIEPKGNVKHVVAPGKFKSAGLLWYFGHDFKSKESDANDIEGISYRVNFYTLRSLTYHVELPHGVIARHCEKIGDQKCTSFEDGIWVGDYKDRKPNINPDLTDRVRKNCTFSAPLSDRYRRLTLQCNDVWLPPNERLNFDFATPGWACKEENKE